MENIKKCDCGHPCESYPDCIKRIIIGFVCPECGNEVGSYAQEHPGDPVMCSRCENGEYTEMLEIYADDITDED